jgi:TPR repeat protein
VAARGGRGRRPRGAYELGYLLRRREEFGEAEKWLRVAAEEQPVPLNIDALASLLDQTGRRDEAVALYERAAREGYAPAARNLGWLLEGEGDEERAEALWRRAAEGGITTAARNLGILLEDRDRDEAIRWCRTAAADDGEYAVRRLDELRERR